jgi:hypothetical protein
MYTHTCSFCDAVVEGIKPESWHSITIDGRLLQVCPSCLERLSLIDVLRKTGRAIEDDPWHGQFKHRFTHEVSDLRVTFSKKVEDGGDWLAAVVQFADLFGMIPCWSDDNHDSEVVFRAVASAPCPLCAAVKATEG